MKNKGLLIAVGLGIVVGLGGWYFLVYKPAQDKKKAGGKDDKTKKDIGGATTDQFDKFVKTSTGVGSDVFEGVKPDKLAEIRNNFTSKLTKEEADKLIAIFGKKESEWSASEKIDFAKLFFKFTGKKQ